MQSLSELSQSLLLPGKFVKEPPRKVVKVVKSVKEPTINNQHVVIKDMERCILVIIEFLLRKYFCGRNINQYEHRIIYIYH